MGFSDETYAAARKYTDDTVAGAGGLAGVPCQIQSIIAITGGNRVTFLWIDNNGVEHTSTMNVMDGIDGEDGKGIQSVSVNAENHLIITYTDGTTADAGQIEIHSAVDSVNGQTGAVTLDAEDVGALPANTPIPSKTSDLINDSGFITKAVNDLVSYYLKSETYSKTQVDDIITAVKNSRFEVVATLPTTDIKTNVIYLVPKDPAQTSNVKDEYINLNGTTAGWEKIGDTEIDLSDYVTTQALNTALAAYTKTADLTTLLAGKQDTLTFDNAPTENSNNPVKSGGVYSADANIYAEITRQGVKNILSQQFDEVMITSSLGNKATSANGLTLTYNSDGSIKINGTPTDSSKNVAIRFDWDTNNHPFDISYLAGKKVVVSISETEINGIKIIPGYFDASDGAHQYSGADITTKGEYTYPNDTKWARCYLSISGAYSYSDVTVYPMIYIPFEGATDDYEPYAKTNQELTYDSVDWYSNGIIGAKNLIPFPYPKKSDTVLGIDFTTNSNGEIIASGTSTGIAVYDVVNTELYGWNVPREGTYILSDGLSNADYEYAYTAVTFMYDDGTIEYNVGDTSVGRTVITIPSNLKNFYVGCCVRTDKTVSNIKFKPMLRLATDTDSTYQPYAMTNQQITPYVQSITNPNLLDNPWFTVNQRGASSYSTNGGYTVDRWRNWSTEGEVITVNSDNSLTLTKSATDKTLNIVQVIEESVGELLVGKTVTASVMLGNGKVKSVSGIVEKSNDFRIGVAIDDTTKARLDFYRYADEWNIRIISWAGGASAAGSITIKAMKLEIGTVSTLAMDTAPNAQQELAKCQRYFIRVKTDANWGNIGWGKGSADNNVVGSVVLPTPMRTTPTMSYSALSAFTLTDTSNHTPTAIVLQALALTNAKIKFTIDASTAGDMFQLMLNTTNDYLDFSADL